MEYKTISVKSSTHHQIVEVHGEKVLTSQHGAKRCHSFSSSKHDVENRSITRSGRSSSSTTEINTARIVEMLQNDRRETLCEVLSELELSLACSISLLMCCDISRQCCENIHRHLAEWTGT
ncbi:hypothetical protein TNCV_417391 [Trichonephila clavipes]|nr:hypothetical protein TNCV_417391 [Trichonephila clavipes]